MKRYGFLAGCIIFACGVMWSNLALANDAACPQPSKDCKQSLVLAKGAQATQPVCFEKVDCLTSTNSCDDCIMRMKWELPLQSGDIETACDETVNLIPNGSKLSVDLTYHIRRNGPCKTTTFPNGTPVGTHEGNFKITSPSGVILATGKMHGTNGLENFYLFILSGACCADRHYEGCMEGELLGKNCKFMATYASIDIPTDNPTDACSEGYWRDLNLFINGIVQCKCSKTVGYKADLVAVPLPGVSGPMGYCRSDDSGRLVVRVMNRGTAPAPRSTTRVKCVNREPSDMFDVSTPALMADSFFDVVFEVPPNPCVPPNPMFTIVVDVNNDVNESRERNNEVIGRCSR